MLNNQAINKVLINGRRHRPGMCSPGAGLCAYSRTRL